MKKLLKLALIVVLTLSLAIVVTGCGKKEENNNNEANTQEQSNNSTDATTTNSGKSKTFSTFSAIKDDYVISLEGTEDVGEGEENIVMTMAVKGDKMYADVKATSQHLTVLYKDNATYLISHDEKMYMVQEGKDESTFSEMTLFTEEDLKEMETSEYSTGKETIDGTEYDYEEFKDDETATIERFYFSGNELRYIKDIDEDGTEELLKVNTISSEVDDSLFDVPEDYEKAEM